MLFVDILLVLVLKFKDTLWGPPKLIPASNLLHNKHRGMLSSLMWVYVQRVFMTRKITMPYCFTLSTVRNMFFFLIWYFMIKKSMLVVGLIKKDSNIILICPKANYHFFWLCNTKLEKKECVSNNGKGVKFCRSE